MWRYIFASIAGFIGHQAKRITDGFAPGFDNIANYVIGWFLLLFAMLLHVQKHDRAAFVATFSAAAVWTGAGVVVGYLLDKLIKNKRGKNGHSE